MKRQNTYGSTERSRQSHTALAVGAAQRTCACGAAGPCASCSENTASPASVQDRTRTSGRGHSFGDVPVFAGAESHTLGINDQTPAQTGESDEKTTPASAVPDKTAQPDASEATTNDPNMPVIDSVELVTSSSGAVGGYRSIEVMCDASLNNPGPFNDIWAKGSIANVLQVQFHLSHGSPTDVRAARVVNRTASAGGKHWTKVGDDSPPPHEYQFTNDKMVVADAPGWCNEMLDKDFPVTYSGDFSVYAYDPLTRNILASIAYHVEISKQSYGQIDAVNTVSVTDTKIGAAVASPYKPKSQGP